MRIALHDAEKDHFRREKTFPNLALMKLSAWHKLQGDTVEWWNPLYRYDRIYSSKIFDFTPEDPYLPEHAIRCGTGYKDVPVDTELPPEIDSMYPDYSIYPKCDYAIGYLTRGCPNHCRWCVVPLKEGQIRPYRTWEQVVRPDTDKLVLMDNNILAIEHGIEQLESLSHTKYKIDLNQGMDARLVTDEIAQILSRLNWIRYIRFSCDQKSQIEPIKNAITLLGKYGVKPYRIFVYLLVTSNLANAEERVSALNNHSRGICIYAQAERNPRLGIMPNKAQPEYCNRYIYGRCYKSETWEEYCERKGFKWEETK